jgi:hypothetical protein
MKRAQHVATLVAAVLLVPLSTMANDGGVEKTSLDADAAFEAIKGLEGTWIGEADIVREGQQQPAGVKSPAKITFKTIANGTSVTATFAESTPTEMVSLFHQDGKDKLIHTHYCAIGNQPSMLFQKSAEPGLIKFLFTSGTNMDVDKDPHVHNTTFRILDKDTIETETDLWADGKRSAVRRSKLVRQK